MSTGETLRAKAKSLLAKFQATSRVVQFREVTQTGGNTRLGAGGITTATLTPIDPQPAVMQVSAEDISRLGAKVQPGDWEFIFDGTIPESEFQAKQILYGDEVLHIVQYEPYPMNGIVVAWSVIGRTQAPR